MHTTNDRERWLNTTTVASILGVSPDTVRNMIEAGKFDRVRDIGAGSLPRYQVAAEAVRRFEKGVVLEA